MIQLYKPNSKNTGNAFGFRIGAKDKSGEPCVYMTAIQQHSWNEKSKNGSFAENSKNPEKSISIKFNEVEMAGFINAVDKYSSFKAFHSYEGNNTSIALVPYKKKNGEDAFSFSITRNSSQKFGLGVEMSEATLIAEYFRYVLNKIFTFRQERKP
jgi:hypothetical protein